MYRLTEAGMPQDPHYNADLKELGYFIDVDSVIRTIRPPHFYYTYWISNSERVNHAFRDAMHECILREIRERMAALGMPLLYVPHMSPDKPQKEPATPILVTNQQDLKMRKRIIVLVNADCQDLGMLAYRIASKEGGIEAGSVISLAKAMQATQVAHLEKLKDLGPKAPGVGQSQDTSASDMERRVTEAVVAQALNLNGSEATKTDDVLKTDGTGEDEKPAPIDTSNAPFKVPEDWQTPGLVVLNPGQLLYSHRLDKAMTMQSWNSQPRKTAIHPIPSYNTEFNTVPGNRSVAEHVKFVFDNIVNNPEWVSRDANVYIIGNGNGGDAVLDFLDSEWPTYKERVAAITLVDPTPIRYPLKDHDFGAFLRHRARGLVSSEQPAGTPVAVPCTSEHLTPTSSRRESTASRRESTASTGGPPRPQDKAASPWLETVASSGDSPRGFFSSASDALTSSISQLAIDSILASPTTPLRPTPDHSDDWGMHYFPLLSSGEGMISEVIFPSSYRLILAWFELVAATPGYKNPGFRLPEVAPQVADTETDRPLNEAEGEGGKGKQRAEEA